MKRDQNKDITTSFLTGAILNVHQVDCFIGKCICRPTVYETQLA